MYKLIKTINVDRANFEHIATTGNINGTLLIELVRVMKEYHLQQLALTEVVQAKPEKLQPKYCDQCGGSIKNEGHEYGCANTHSGNFEQF